MRSAPIRLLDFVEYLVNAAYDRSMLIVTLARPELLEQRPAWERASATSRACTWPG